MKTFVSWGMGMCRFNRVKSTSAGSSPTILSSSNEKPTDASHAHPRPTATLVLSFQACRIDRMIDSASVAMHQTNAKRLLFIVAVFASGFVSLGYQIVWSKQLAASFGVESIAVLAVITAYMGGLSAGAFLLNRSVQQSSTPLKWLAALEGVIGCWGLMSYWLIPNLSRWTFLQPNVPVAHFGAVMLFFALSLILFLPSTLAMGATLPAMVRSWRQWTRSDRGIGLVYGTNTAGAALGVLLATFSLIPALGLNTTLLLMSATSAFIAVLIWLLHDPRPLREAPTNVQGNYSFSRQVLMVMAALGLLGMSYQILCVRVLSQSLENTVFTYASILAVYLVGTSLGGFLYHGTRCHKRIQSLETTAIFATALVIMLNLQLMVYVPPIFDRLLGDSPSDGLSLQFAEFVIATSVLLLPTIGFGFLFASRIGQSTPDDVAIGPAVGCNLIGAMLAPLLFCALIPFLGTRTLIVAVATGYLCLLKLPLTKTSWSPVAAFALLLILAPSQSRVLGIEKASQADTQLFEGRTGVVAVVSESDGHKRLEVNRRFMMGGSRATIAEQRQAHLPLLLHPDPKEALFLGVGTGITLGAATHHPDLRAHGVELVSEILTNLEAFSDWNHYPYEPDQFQLHLMDARRFIKQSNQRFDVIVADVFHPARDGAGLLYTEEHFKLINTRLADGGLFCQWIPIHQWDRIGLDSLVRTFQSAFPHTSYWLLDIHLGFPVLGLVGTRQAIQVSEDRFEKATSNAELAAQLKTCRMHSFKQAMMCFLGDAIHSQLPDKRIPANTDDFQFVTYHAPLRTGQEAPHELLDRFRNEAYSAEGRTAPSFDDRPWLKPWASFLAARDLYMEGNFQEKQGNLNAALQLYFESIKTSSTFTLAYARCIRIATQQLNQSPHQGTKILEELVRIRPNESLATRLLSRLQQETKQ